MAFTNAPTNDTYSTHIVPLLIDLQMDQGESSPSLSAGMTNIVPIKTSDGEIAVSRVCINSHDVSPNTNSYVCRGVHVWEKTIGTVYYYVVVSDTVGSTSKVYTATSPSGSWTAVTTLTNYGVTPVRFTEFIDDSNTKKLVMVDGIEGYVFTDNTAGTKITDADFPTPHVPFPVFMDGYLFLAKSGTGDIYNSDLNDPAVWTAGSFISSEMYPDDIQALARIGSYILSIGSQSCEYFYDAANPTGSPLARQEGSALTFGTPFPDSIASSDGQLVLLANNNDGSTSLQLINGLNTKEINCPFIEVLTTLLSTATTSPRGWFFRQNSELFYGINFHVNYSGNPDPLLNPTFVYSFSTDKWTSFQYGSSQSNPLAFPVFYTASSTSNSSLTFVAGHGGKGVYNASNMNVFFGTLTLSNSVHYTDTFYTTAGVKTEVAIYCEVRTPPQDFGTLNLKTQSRLGIDYYKLNNYASSITFNIDWTDYGIVDSSSSSSNTSVSVAYTTYFPFVYQLGSFRKRSYRIGFTTDGAIRLNGIECSINKGQR